MRRRLPYLAVIVLTVSLVPTASRADVTVQYLGPLTPPPSLHVAPQGDFLMGRADDPFHLLADPDVYMAYTRAAFVDPLAQGCTCPEGYTVDALGIVVAKVGNETRTATLILSLGHGLERDFFLPGTVCITPPGPSFRYQDPFYCRIDATFTVTIEGFYLLTLTGPDACGCIRLRHTQALHVPLLAFEDVWGQDLFLVTDDDSAHCPDYVADPSMGSLWYSEIAAPGGLLVWADATCCENPVPVEIRSWGAVKAIYR